jgi:uncharacterized protein YcfL
MKTQILLLLAGVGLFALSGCTTVNTVENAQKEGQRQMVTDQRAITDASLNRKVFIVGVNQSMTPGGVLKVQVELQNRTSSLQRFNYRFEWFDASALLPDQIEGQESKFIIGVAPNSNCKDFRVKFIEAQ